MPRKGNKVVGEVHEVGETTIKIEGVVYTVGEAPRAYLKYYKPGQRVYADIKQVGGIEVVSFLMDYEKWKAKFPKRATEMGIDQLEEKIATTVAQTVDKKWSANDDLRIMQSAAACATGLVKSMIERGWFGAVNDDTAMEKVRPTMNQLMFAIYTDQKQILSANQP